MLTKKIRFSRLEDVRTNWRSILIWKKKIKWKGRGELKGLDIREGEPKGLGASLCCSCHIWNSGGETNANSIHIAILILNTYHRVQRWGWVIVRVDVNLVREDSGEGGIDGEWVKVELRIESEVVLDTRGRQ